MTLCTVLCAVFHNKLLSAQCECCTLYRAAVYRVAMRPQMLLPLPSLIGKSSGGTKDSGHILWEPHSAAELQGVSHLSAQHDYPLRRQTLLMAVPASASPLQMSTEPCTDPALLRGRSSSCCGVNLNNQPIACSTTPTVAPCGVLLSLSPSL